MRFETLSARAVALALATLPFASAAPAPRNYDNPSCDSEVVIVHNGARHTTHTACPVAAATFVPTKQKDKGLEDTIRALKPYLDALEAKDGNGQHTIIVSKTESHKVSSPTHVTKHSKIGKQDKDAVKDAKLGKRQTGWLVGTGK